MRTSTQDEWRTPRRQQGQSGAGLVLLYADEHETLPAAFALEGDATLIGREAGAASIVIPQRAVSRIHARIARTGEAFTVRDLDSHNGVMVSGRRVAESPLSPGDELRIGDALFKLVLSNVDDYARYRLDGTVAKGARPVELPGAVGGFQLARVSAVIRAAAKGTLPVLIHGETGTGKELAAQAVHALSERRGPFRAVNCAAIAPNLIESELFGHVRGAFTGAVRDHVGLIRAAHSGTLLLDELGDMPLEAQTKLLRTLEAREVVPVGAVKPEPVDVRVVAATHKDLRAEVEAGRFRADLFARLNGHAVVLPPLRERKEDLYPLVRHFLREAGQPERRVLFRFMLGLCHYAWPYNVRELSAAVRRALAVAGDAPLDADHLPETVIEVMARYGERGEQPAAPPGDAPTRSRRPDAGQLAELLARERGNVSAVARALDKDRGLVDRWIRAAGLDPASYRGP